MEKLLIGKEKEKKARRNQLIIGIVLIGLMVLSTAGYALTSKEGSQTTSQSTTYNGIKFIKNTDYWQFSYNGNDYATRYNPDETKDAKVSGSLHLSDLSGKPLYFVGDNSEAVSELARNLNNQVLRIQRACFSSINCSSDYPIKDCTDNVIVLKEPGAGESASVYKTDNCMFIVANATEQTKYADSVLFRVLNI